jgi:hypothetical protein
MEGGGAWSGGSRRVSRVAGMENVNPEGWPSPVAAAAAPFKSLPPQGVSSSSSPKSNTALVVVWAAEAATAAAPDTAAAPAALFMTSLVSLHACKLHERSVGKGREARRTSASPREDPTHPEFYLTYRAAGPLLSPLPPRLPALFPAPALAPPALQLLNLLALPLVLLGHASDRLGQGEVLLLQLLHLRMRFKPARKSRKVRGQLGQGDGQRSLCHCSARHHPLLQPPSPPPKQPLLSPLPLPPHSALSPSPHTCSHIVSTSLVGLRSSAAGSSSRSIASTLCLSLALSSRPLSAAPEGGVAPTSALRFSSWTVQASRRAREGKQ